MSRATGSRPMMERRKVDFPAPFAPISATTSPWRNLGVDAIERLEIAVSGDKPMCREDDGHTSIPM